ncbi:MAG TPA: septal ring lytic transglycosylase RlpA family protein [Macromonas sp.]|nr:septal ring lytic transglycosylase RlpA family protein [Macromonas sp.]
MPVNPVASISSSRSLSPELQAEVDRLFDAAAQPMVLEQGQASYYANRFHGRRTASGERYDKNALTAAHKTLPFGTEVLVRSLQTGKAVMVRIIDRGPYLKNRIIDLSHAAAQALGMRQQGVSEVQLIKPEKSQGFDLDQRANQHRLGF